MGSKEHDFFAIDLNLLLKLFYIQCKEIGKNKYYEETTEPDLKNGKVRFRLNIDVRKEDSKRNAIECLKTDYVRKRSTEF